jgi:hypothetical protein
MEDNSQFRDSELIEKFSSELVNYVRLISGVQDPSAELLRSFYRNISEHINNGGTTP